MEVHVTPKQYLALQKLNDEATRTIDGKIDESIWFKGVVEILGERTVMEAICSRGMRIVVDWGVQQALDL